MDKTKCADLLAKYDYLGKDARDNHWGHLYFGHKAAAEEKEQYIVQCGVFSDRANADKLVQRLKAAGFDAIVK